MNSLPQSKKTDEKSAKILIVDDVDFNRIYMELILRNCGYACDLAVNGLEALEKLDMYDYQIVFMDGQMPEMNGFETVQKIRAQAKYANLKIFCTSTLRDLTEEKHDRCEKCLVNGYLSKPFTEKEVRKLFRGHNDSL